MRAEKRVSLDTNHSTSYSRSAESDRGDAKNACFRLSWHLRVARVVGPSSPSILRPRTQPRNHRRAATHQPNEYVKF